MIKREPRDARLLSFPQFRSSYLPRNRLRQLSHELDEKNTIISSIYSRIGYDEDAQNSGYNILDYIKRWKPE